jgi:hypothetical protein
LPVRTDFRSDWTPFHVIWAAAIPSKDESDDWQAAAGGFRVDEAVILGG